MMGDRHIAGSAISKGGGWSPSNWLIAGVVLAQPPVELDWTSVPEVALSIIAALLPSQSSFSLQIYQIWLIVAAPLAGPQ
jgi:hypothetical protein